MLWFAEEAGARHASDTDVTHHPFGGFEIIRKAER